MVSFVNHNHFTVIVALVRFKQTAVRRKGVLCGLNIVKYCRTNEQKLAYIRTYVILYYTVYNAANLATL